VNLHEATQKLAARIEENMPDWVSAPEGTPALAEIYADTNAALDPDKRILTDETLDDLFATYCSAVAAEQDAYRHSNPAGRPRKAAAAQRAVHDFLDDMNLALLRAGYDGERTRADTLGGITL
jgi:hypothetical protein